MTLDFCKFKRTVLMAHLQFLGNGDYDDWLRSSFRKVVCEVSDEDFEKLKLEANRIIVTESGLGGIECATVFCPRCDWPDYFKTFILSKY